MKCEDCEFWSKLNCNPDYGNCTEPEQVRMDKELEESELYCCTSFVAAKITKE